MTSLKKQEIESLRNAPGMIADGGETHPDLWELERRGYLRPVFSYNRVHYRDDDSGWYNFTRPIYVYTRTEFGETTNALYEELEQRREAN